MRNISPYTPLLCVHWNLTVTLVCVISLGASGVTIMFSSPILPWFLLARHLCCWQQMELLFTSCAYDPTEIRQEMNVETVLSAERLRCLGGRHSFAGEVSKNCGSESSDMFEPRLTAWVSAWQLTNVDSTLTTMLQRCANNVLSDGNPHPLYG